MHNNFKDCHTGMESGEAFNFTVSHMYHNNGLSTISIDGTVVFIVFSVTLNVLTHSDITVALSDIKTSEYLTNYQLQHPRRICVERDINSYPNKTYFCPYTDSRKTQTLIVWNSKHNTDRNVSTVIIIFLS